MLSTDTEIETYSFRPDDLRVVARQPGVSAFMRIRDGAFSLEAAIRSHINHFDEIVAVYNRCTDATPEILARLSQEFGPRLRTYHYVPSVFPPGSEGHRTEPAHSPHSLVNYYNCALSLTRFTHATKLDDDHIAMQTATARLMADVRSGLAARNEMACFSGLNLACDTAGTFGILRKEPFSGSGDIAVFPVTPETYFAHDRRFEVFHHPGLKRRFHSLVYWHLKYLKPEFGFANYDLATNPKSRYGRRLSQIAADRPVEPLDAETSPDWREHAARWRLPLPERDQLIAARAAASRILRRNLTLSAALADSPELASFVR